MSILENYDAAATQRAVELAEKVIGEDPRFLEDGSLDPMPYALHNIREELRAEQRAVLRELTNKKEKKL